MILHLCPACYPSRVIYLMLLVLTCALLSIAAKRAEVTKTQLRLVEVKEPNGQILSYGHLAGSTEVRLRGTRRAPDARVKLKVGSRPGFVELDINRGGISGLKPANSFGKDFLTYVLWAVSVDGKASNLGEITFHGDNPVAVNLTTPYQTFWLMVTAEPNYAVVDPSQEVVLYSVKDGSDDQKNAIAINRPLFFFTHYATYESAASGKAPDVPNQLLQARKAVQLASNSGLLETDVPDTLDVKEQEYAHEALTQARTFLTRAENAYRKDRNADEVIQFARTAAQSAENARALATGAVGGLLVHQMERELADLRTELARLRVDPPLNVEAPASASASTPAAAAPPPPLPQSSVVAQIVSLATQPALWFAMSGWGLAIALLSRRRTI
jgi:hypothetical protein